LKGELKAVRNQREEEDIGRGRKKDRVCMVAPSRCGAATVSSPEWQHSELQIDKIRSVFAFRRRKLSRSDSK